MVGFNYNLTSLINHCGLRESDIPGTSLNGRKPEDLKVAEVK